MPRLSRVQQQSIRELYLSTDLSLEEIRDQVGLSKSSKQVEKLVEEEGLEALKDKIVESVEPEVEELETDHSEVVDRLRKAGLSENDARNALRRALESMEEAGNANATSDEVFIAATSFIGSGSLIRKTTDSGREGVAIMTPEASRASTSTPSDPNTTSRHLKNATMRPKGDV